MKDDNRKVVRLKRERAQAAAVDDVYHDPKCPDYQARGMHLEPCPEDDCHAVEECCAHCLNEVIDDE